MVPFIAAVVAMSPTAPRDSAWATPNAFESERTNVSSPVFAISIVDTRVATRFTYPNGYVLAPAGSKLLVVKYRVRNPASYAVQFSRIDSGVLLKSAAGNYVKHSGSVNLLLQSMIGPRGSIEDTVWFFIPKAEQFKDIYIRRGVETTPVPIGKALAIDTDTFLSADGNARDEAEAKFGARTDLGPWSLEVKGCMEQSGDFSRLLSPMPNEKVFCVPFQAKCEVDGPIRIGRGSILIEAQSRTAAYI